MVLCLKMNLRQKKRHLSSPSSKSAETSLKEYERHNSAGHL